MIVYSIFRKKVCYISQLISANLINDLVNSPNVKTKLYTSGDFVFQQGDFADSLSILLNGKIHISQVTPSGRSIQIASISKKGELFGEVFFFLSKNYDYFAEVASDSTILQVSKSFFSGSSEVAQELTQKMLLILSGKAYYLNKKIQILSGTTIRQKIIRFLLNQMNDNQEIHLTLTREKLADFLGIARPSLSRELMLMQSENLILIKGKYITIVSLEKTDEFL